MRALDDLANPFLAQYEELDYWCYAHAGGPSDAEREAFNDGLLPALTQLLSVAVDHNGFPMPQRQGWREYYAQRANGTYYSADAPCVRAYSVFGEMSAELHRSMYAMQMECAAAYVAKIPRWLGEHPPPDCLILPSGEVVTSGLLDTGRGEYETPGPTYVIPEETFYRYSVEGELLDQTTAGEFWWSFYFPDWDAVAAQYDIGGANFCWSDAGHVEIMDGASGDTLAVYTIDGQAVPLETDLNQFDSPQWDTFCGLEIELLYEIQSRLPQLAKDQPKSNGSR